jgi:hypothetical protein
MSAFLVVVLLVLLALMAALGRYYSQREIQRRALLAVPKTSVAEAPEGQWVRLVGRVQTGDRVLRAPLSQRTCVAFRVLVEEPQGRHSKPVPPLVYHHESVAFAIEDASGIARIEGTSEQVLIDLDHRERWRTLEDASAEVQAYLSRHSRTSGSNRSRVYREGVLTPDEIVTVVGLACWEDDPSSGAVDPSQGGFRDAPRKKRLVLRPTPDTPVYASDLESLQR